MIEIIRCYYENKTFHDTVMNMLTILDIAIFFFCVKELILAILKVINEYM